MPIIFQILTPTSRIFGGAGKLSKAPVSSCCSGSDISNTLSPPSDFATSWFLRPMIQIHSVAPAFQTTSHQTPATRKTKKTFQLMQKRNVWRWSSTSVSSIRLASPPSESAAFAAQAAASLKQQQGAEKQDALPQAWSDGFTWQIEND